MLVQRDGISMDMQLGNKDTWKLEIRIPDKIHTP